MRPPRIPYLWFFFGEIMRPERIVCFVDGFNIYHALDNLQNPSLKWLNLQLLFSRLIRPRTQIITQILFFSAYPTWKPDSYRRHRLYVKALSTHGVTPIMGQFKNKPRKCLECHAKWISHEEKETDVNLALALLDLAYKDQYDHAFIASRDSDLAPAIRKVKQNFSNKKISIFSPFNYRHSSELMQAADRHKTITFKHISTSLFSEKVYDAGGNLVVTRPVEYATIKERVEMKMSFKEKLRK
jgi:uncharacterized LabA/DUF88 family protein